MGVGRRRYGGGYERRKGGRGVSENKWERDGEEWGREMERSGGGGERERERERFSFACKNKSNSNATSAHL